ncbi:PREDICTED: anaphase-promoting complex subunit 1-like [Papilio xuthus]|uniref:Anaphase-promoting complex subunit 1-like n=1 Tax=Papilio xuthus TaxID=66420 RepID=A0AAJ6YZ94_PAPXU|nr:PREDICTED: anaphase-promoting complex subunit 1-like [Papilio xuthus]
MIAASEPLEFVPHGRTVLSKHPGQIYGKGLNNSSSENSLMYKLANFAIKDESLLESKDSGEEWWCIREIYYRETGDVDEDETQQSTKEKYEDSFRPPSRIKPEFNISIKSELLSGMKRTEGEPGTSQGGSANSSSNMSKKFNLNSSQNKQPMTKPLNPKTDCSYEEELYVKGCTAVWSKGLISTPGTKLSGPEQRETIACYTIENPIKHAAFCDFHIGINNTMLLDALNSQIGDVKKNIKIEDTTEHIETNIMPSILLMDSKCMRVYAVDGREYITSIPFQVKKVWPMKYGVLLEKEPLPQLHNSLLPTSFFKLNESCNSSLYKSKTNAPFNMSAKLRAESLVGYDQEYPLPTCFSLSHPLDEVIPILIKSPSQGLQYYSDGDVQIIFVSVNPSIILLYDWKLGYHSLWKIRKATREECLNMCPNINSTTTVFSQSCDFVGSPMQSMAKNTTSWNAGSPFQSKKGMNTPNRSRQNSPMAHIFHQQGLSPHASIGQASSTSMLANSINQTPPSLPLYPDICLDHIWTDSQVIRRDQVESPTDIKTFLHTDLVGHNYLCFLVKVGGANKLQILRLQKSHSHGQLLKSNLIVGAVSSVYAKDAVVLNDLKMIALIDESGNIILQSGNSVVGKVHVGGVLARLLDSPYTKRAAHPLALPSLHSPFPRRSSLLPSRTDCTFDDSALHLLSPVPHSSTSRIEHKESLGLRGVRDAAGRRVTLCLENGVLYRIALPPLAAAALPPRAALALRALLPRDIAMQVLIKWYGVRNAPGTQDLTPEQEWSMFSKLLLTLIGYDVERLGQIRQSDEDGTEVASKKQRTSSDGTQDDWDYLLNSRMHKAIGSSLACMLNLSPTQPESKHWKGKTKTLESDKPVQFNTNSLLFPYMLQVFYAFHLLYEDLKLNVLLSSNLKPLSSFLYQLAKDLRLNNYVNHYWLDFPNDYHYECMETDSQVSDVMLKKLSPPNYFSPEPPGIFSYLNSMLKNCDVGYYPYLPEVNDTCRDLIEILSTVGCGSGAGVQPLSLQVLGSSTPRPRRDSGPAPAPHAQAALLAAHRGITLRGIDNFPPAIGLMLLSIFNRSKSAPREEELTGMEHLNTKLLTLLYPRDHRMTEVFRLLQSSIPATINLTQRPEVSDHDFIEEQEKFLYAITTRTTALPVARGMVTLRTVPAGATEPARPARLCVTGRGPPPRCHAVTLSDTAPAALLWPSFHNGAAAGLALVPVAGRTIHHSWIVYNKPRGTQDMSAEHAGFLLALGLNGHLRDMPYMNMFDYFVKCNEMISIGLLLGLAATYRGTMDVQATKMMSIHLEALLPPTSIELDIQQNILVAALLGVGLLYQATAHAHYAQVLLNEIGKPPGPELENCVEREGYALAAGLALGLVCVGAGDSAPPHLAPRLRAYVLGGERHAYGREGCGGGVSSGAGGGANVDVTSPGATLALGLLYLRAGQCAPAAWLAPPATPYLLDFVRPDLLMLRVIARGLILWDSIEASEEWVEEQVPATIRPYCFVKPSDDNIDYEAMNQAYCNIISGACFALGLRFAGSGDEDALEAVLSSARRLLDSEDNRYHLQAFRHLYVLAVEPRLLLPRDLDTGKLCYAHVQVVDLQGVVKEMKAPCIIPELDGLKEVKINDPRYWPIVFRRDQNWDQLKKFLNFTWCIDIKQRAGCLSYVSDPHGFLTILAHTLTLDKTNMWLATPDNIDLFTNDDKVRSFVKHHLHGEHASGAGGGPQGSGGVAGASGGGACADCLVALRRRARGEGVPRVCRCRRYSREEEEHAQALSMLTYECLVKDSLCALPLWATFLKIIKAMRTEPTSYDVWQMRLLVSLAEQQSAAAAAEMPVDGDEAPAEPLVSAELALALKQRVAALLDDWQPRLAPALRRYAGAGGASAAGRRSGEEARHALAAYVLYHGVRAGQCGAGRARAAALACAPAPPAAAVAALAPLLS